MNFIKTILVVLLCWILFPGLAFISPVGTTNPSDKTTTTPASAYIPTKEENAMIAECYFHRFWERTESELDASQTFCMRLATNDPNDSEKASNRFTAYRNVWNQISEIVYLPIWDEPAQVQPQCITYQLAEGEKQEIEECYFSRQWQRTSAPLNSRNWRDKDESTLSYHETFCKRLATNSPNEVEQIGTSFAAYRQAWNSTIESALDDLAQILECCCKAFSNLAEKELFLFGGTCKPHFDAISSPLTSRDRRRKEMHDCLRIVKDGEGPKKDSCTTLVISYKKTFYSGSSDTY